MIDMKIVSSLDVIINLARGLTKSKLSSYCDLDSTLPSDRGASASEIPDNSKIIAKDGSFVTVFELTGSKNIVGSRELDQIVEVLSSGIAPSLRDEGHQIQFVFCRDKDRVVDEIRDALAPIVKRAKQIDIYIDDLIESKINNISRLGNYESCYIAIWSRPKVVTTNLKEEQLKISEKKKTLPPSVNSQDIFNYMEAIDVKHTAFASTIAKSLENAGLMYSILNVKKAVLEAKKSINHKLVSNNWSPYTVDDTPPIRPVENIRVSEDDVGNALWPSISEQIFPTDAEKISYDTIRFGDKYIASMAVTLPPKRVRVPFNHLVQNINPDIPYQISFMIEGGGLNSTSLKALFAALLVVTNSMNNRSIKDSLEEMKKREGQGDVFVKTSISVSTWADDKDVLKSRKERLLKSIQSWGDTEAKLTTGDPIGAFLSTVPAMTYKSDADSFCIPIEEITHILPLSRSSKIWKSGSIINLSSDGKIAPYQTMSSLQNTWNTIIFATPGLGKSARLNAENMATILTPSKSNDIPYIGILDMGPSSNGLIQSLRARFPKDKRHLFIYKKLQNTLDYSINVFDTYPGCRIATPSDKSFLVNFLSTIVSADDESFPIDKMISKIIDLAYIRFSDSDTGQPKKYIKAMSKEVDEAIEAYSINYVGKSWWYIVDSLFAAGAIHASKLAQRFAVPLLEDCIAVAQTESQITSIYTNPKVGTGESAIDFFCRSISEAISMYPLISQHTVFDLGDAKVISLDLNDVGKTSGSATDNKRASTMFMLGRYIIGKNIKQDESLLNVSPKMYHKYHNTNIDINKTLIKKICIDEFHNAAKIPSFVSQVVTDMREGRKWKLEVVLASQFFTDFTDEIINASTTVQILSGGDVYNDLGDKFKLNNATRQIVKSRLNGPTDIGVPYIFKVITKAGTFVQFLYNSMCPLEILSYSTTAEDNQLLNELSKIIGYLSAIKEIANRYPKGFKRHLEDDIGDISDNDDSVNIYEKEAMMIARDFNNKKSNRRG